MSSFSFDSDLSQTGTKSILLHNNNIILIFYMLLRFPKYTSK